MRYRALCVIESEDYSVLINKLIKIDANVIDIYDKLQEKWLKGVIKNA